MKMLGDPVIIAFVAVGIIATIGFFFSIFWFKYLNKFKKQ